MKLSELVAWIVSGGGAGVVSYFLWRELEDTWPDYLGKLSPKVKRRITLAIAAVLGSLMYLVSTAMGYEPTPESVKMWIESIFSVIALSIGLSQLIHGEKDL